MVTIQAMTTSKKLWLGFVTLLTMLVLCGAMLLISWPSSSSLQASQESASRNLRPYLGIAFGLVIAAGVVAGAMSVAVRRSLVTVETRLRENSDERYRLSSEAAGLGAYSYDFETQTPDWSPELKHLFGLPDDAVVTRERILELIHPNDCEFVRQRFSGNFTPPEGLSYDSEFRIVRPDGQECWLHDRGTFTYTGSQSSRRPVRARGMISDITNRKQEEDLLDESEQRHRAAFDGSSVGMCQADPKTGRLLRVNRYFCEMTGYSNSELVDRPCHELIEATERDVISEGLDRLNRRQISEYRAEHRFVHKSGRIMWGDVTVNLVQGISGRPLRTLSVIKNITERKQAEEKVRDAEQRLLAFLDNSTVCGWMKDEAGRYVFLSKNYLRYLGVPLEEMQGKTDFDHWPQATAEQFRRNDQQVLESNCPIEVVEQGWNVDRTPTYWLCHKFPYQDASGKRFVGGLGVDITNQKRTEEALRENEQQLSLVLQGANVGFWDWNCDGDRVHFSREWKSQLGYAEDEISDRFDEWQSRVHPDDLERSRAQVRSFIEKPWPNYELEFRMRHKNASWRWILARASLIDGPNGQPIRMIGIHLDITERKEAEESLRESEEQLRLVNEAANIGTYFAEFENDRVRYSPELCAMLGVEFGIDRKLEDGFQFVSPEDLRRIRTDFGVAANPAGDGHQRTEVRIRRPGGEVRWLMTSGRVSFQETPAGRVPWRLVGACLDITERKQIEESLRQLNEELEERVDDRTRVLYAKQERLQAILNNSFNAVLTCDRQGQVESVNVAAVKMFGYSVNEMIGQDFRKFVPPPDAQSADGTGRSYLEMGLTRMTGYSLEVVARRKDGSTFPADLAVSEITHLGLFCSILRDISENKRLERELAEATAFEQRRIGQDLHDSVGQRLTALTMLAQDFVESLGAAAESSDRSPNHLDQPALPPTLSNLSPIKLAERLRRDLQQTLEQVRAISRNLNPVPVDSQGLMAALADLIEQVRLQSRVSCFFDCESPVVIEDNVTGTHLFHIAQEALSNALQHAHAREVRISLWQDDLQIVLQIQDDGDGISWPLPQREGIGLRIMKSRSDMIGATLTFDRAKPKGTDVTCTLKNAVRHQV